MGGPAPAHRANCPLRPGSVPMATAPRGGIGVRPEDLPGKATRPDGTSMAPNGGVARRDRRWSRLPPSYRLP